MFVELLGRSCFSFLRGGSHPEELVSRASELGLDALALCDWNGLYGVVRGWVRHKELKMNTSSSRRGCPPLKYYLGAEVSPSGWSEGADGLTLALLVQSAQGYQNLCRLLTRGHEEGTSEEFFCPLESLALHAEGLYAIVVPPRDVASLEQKDEAALFASLKRSFDTRLALGIYRHLDGFDSSRRLWVEAQAARTGIPIVASARPLYHDPERKPLTDVLHCIRRGLTLDEAQSELSSNSEQFLRGEDDMRRLFRDHPEWLEKSGEIAATLHFDLSELRYQFPCDLGGCSNADERLEELTWEGVARRFPSGISDELHSQIKRELQLIAQIQVAPYFLSTRDIVEIARDKQILCQGRGSAANSAVCYALGITAVDPSRSKLLFDRFLSAERAEPPDIDVDFEHERREEVIQEIYARYGRDRAAMVSEVICYRGKSSLREVGKAFGLSLEQVERLSQTITWWNQEVEEMRLDQEGFDISDSRLAQVVTLANQLRGFPRHLSIHVGGFVLSARPLYEVAPIEPARMPGRTVIPWDKDDIDALGFFKVDCLGLGMLTAIRKALELVHTSGGLQIPAFDPSAVATGQALGASSAGAPEPFSPLEVVTRIPKEDSATYDMICRADTIGVFQIESRAQMSMLPRLQPRSFYDLVIEVALVRPGPIQGGMVHPYLRRRKNEEAVNYPHPCLESILERTLGVPLFQEQVMQIAIVGAGYTGGQADQLRRDMAAWKKSGRLYRHKERLLQGFRARGINADFSAALFEQIKGFGEYGFPESHASSFALLVYVSSWLKAHYPAHFTCALLNSQPMGFYAPATLIRDAQKHGVRIEDVCIERSDWDSTLELPEPDELAAPAVDNGLLPHLNRLFLRSSKPGVTRKIRLGFRLIQGLGEESSRRILSARAERPFSSVEDVARRARLKRNEMHALAQSGAFEKLEPGRRNALWKTRAPRTEGLFEGRDNIEPTPELPQLRAAEQLRLDYEHKGLCVADHPLCHYRRRLRSLGAIRAADIFYLSRGAAVKLGGVVLNRQRPGTASGVVFMSLEDETGLTNLIVKPEIFDTYSLVARRSDMLWVEGWVERDERLIVGDKSQTPVIHVVARHFEQLRSAVTHRLATKRTPEASELRKLSRNFR